MMLWPLCSSFSVVPANVLLQNHMAARQEAPQRPLSAQQEAAVWMVFTRPLQQALHTEKQQTTQQELQSEWI